MQLRNIPSSKKVQVQIFNNFRNINLAMNKKICKVIRSEEI